MDRSLRSRRTVVVHAVALFAVVLVTLTTRPDATPGPSTVPDVAAEVGFAAYAVLVQAGSHRGRQVAGDAATKVALTPRSGTGRRVQTEKLALASQSASFAVSHALAS